MSSRGCILFAVAGATFAVPTVAVREIVPIPRLWRPPAAAPALLGVFDLRGEAMPVLRLDRLLGLAPWEPGPFAAVIVLRQGWAMAAERALAALPAGEPAPLPAGSSYNGCVAGGIRHDGGLAALLAPERLLAAAEAEALARFRDEAARRLAEWSAAGASG